jgi:serine/threonine-protein kinase
MLQKFDFCDREQELQELIHSFVSEVIKKRRCLSYLVEGRTGIGKSRLIEEFLNEIENNRYIAAKIPHFNRQTNIIEYDCTREQSEPYLPFMEITKQIRAHAQKLRILRRLGMLAISIFPIHDIVDDLQRLAEEIRSGEAEDTIRTKELKVFQSYLKVLKKRSRKAPLIIYIRNVQWIDSHSLELLHALIDDDSSFWGMIILEEDEADDANEEIRKTFRILSQENKLRRLPLRTLQKGFEIQIMEKLFGHGLFTAQEYEYIYTLSEGVPGILEKYLEEWMAKNWLTKDRSGWHKADGFEEKIKPPYDKLLDLIITVLQDGEMSPREEALVKNFAKEWNIDPSTVASTVDLVLKAQKLGYDIERRLRSGSLGSDAFLAHDKDRNRYIVEYIPQAKFDNKEISIAEITHPRLLPLRRIVPCDKGLIIVRDYVEGKTLKEFKQEIEEQQIQRIIQIAVQIAEGLQELHRNGYVHGHLRPEAVIHTKDEEIRLATIHTPQIDLHKTLEDEKALNYLPYFSPEQIDGKKPDTRSDIYSFGVLLFELLTGYPPFWGDTPAEIKNAIRLQPLPKLDTIRPPIPVELQPILKKCLQKDPKNRYQNAQELLAALEGVIVKAEPVPSEEPPSNSSKATPSKQKIIPIKNKAVLMTAVFGLSIILVVAGYLIFHQILPSPIKLPDTIIVRNFDFEITDNEGVPFTPDMIQYLIVDDLLQSTDKRILWGHELPLFSGKSRIKPDIEISGNISGTPMGYKINVKLAGILGNRTHSIEFSDPVALLTGKIREITNLVLELYGITEPKMTQFTESWDAFRNFYEGEKAWSKLDLTVAEQKFRAALDIDPGFVLAKLRLAQVLDFGGSQFEARKLLLEIRSNLDKLSLSDSLRAEALLASLSGDLWGEIKLLRRIFNRSPTRKEAAYDLAEAYYGICDIPNAIRFYKIALKIDSNFALAHNHIAYCYTHLGQHKKALEHFRKYVQLDATANAYDSWGDGLAAAGKLDSAAWAKYEGLKLDPNLSYLHQSLCYIEILRGRLSSAEEEAYKYLELVNGPDQKATGYFLIGLISFYRKKYNEALSWCIKAKKLFDTKDVVTRLNENHWLLGLLYLKTGQINRSKNEADEMAEIIRQNNVTPTNYRMGIYKFWLHLRACIAAEEGNFAQFWELVKFFDGPIKSKVKDHTSPFDLAFFNTSFGDLLMNRFNKPELAKERFDLALKYNPDYPWAHYGLWKFYTSQDDSLNAKKEKAKLLKIWKSADEEFRKIYGL